MAFDLEIGEIIKEDVVENCLQMAEEVV